MGNSNLPADSWYLPPVCRNRQIQDGRQFWRVIIKTAKKTDYCTYKGDFGVYMYVLGPMEFNKNKIRYFSPISPTKIQDGRQFWRAIFKTAIK